MHLVIAATQFEMDAFKTVDFALSGSVETFISGVGPVESGVCVTKFLAAHHMKIDCVVNFGIAGAYCSAGFKPIGMLDVCVADSEVLGDFGVCYGNETRAFEGVEFPAHRFDIDRHLLEIARDVLAQHDIGFHTGNFVTVNGASGSKERGDALSNTHGAICENMVGAAIARACAAYQLPFLEVRAISNLVEDRPGSEWKTSEACGKAARAAALIVRKFQDTL